MKENYGQILEEMVVECKDLKEKIDDLLKKGAKFECYKTKKDKLVTKLVWDFESAYDTFMHVVLWYRDWDDSIVKLVDEVDSYRAKIEDRVGL